MKTTRRLFCVVLALILVALSAITLTTASADVIIGDFRLSDDEQILVQYLGTSASPTIPSSVKTIGAAAFQKRQDGVDGDAGGQDNRAEDRVFARKVEKSLAFNCAPGAIDGPHQGGTPKHEGGRAEGAARTRCAAGGKPQRGENQRGGNRHELAHGA